MGFVFGSMKIMYIVIKHGSEAMVNYVTKTEQGWADKKKKKKKKRRAK